MADMGNIIDFNNMDGLPPLVIQKLNNNFWNLINMIPISQVVISSGYSLPDPRVDETIFYDIETGDLYTWYYYENFDPNVYDEPYWGWKKLDVGFIHVEDNSPENSSYIRQEEFIWYDLSSSMIYFWLKVPGEMNTSWISLNDFAVSAVTRWLGDSDNVDLLKSILGI